MVEDEEMSSFVINVCLIELDKIEQFQFIQSNFAEYTLLITNPLD